MPACSSMSAHPQVYLQLLSATYVKSLRSTSLVSFINELTVGRDVKTRIKNLTVLLDPTLCSLILDNAISNAFKHGSPRDPDVQITIGDNTEDPFDCGPSVGSFERFKFTITNWAHPKRRALDEQYVQQVLSGALPEQPNTAVSPMCDKLGLQHCYLAAKAHGIGLSLKQAGQVCGRWLCAHILVSFLTLHLCVLVCVCVCVCCVVVWCGVVWCGVVCRGVVWCGVVWCSVVWCGVSCCGVSCRVVSRLVASWWCGVVWCGVVLYSVSCLVV